MTPTMLRALIRIADRDGSIVGVRENTLAALVRKGLIRVHRIGHQPGADTASLTPKGRAELDLRTHRPSTSTTTTNQE